MRAVIRRRPPSREIILAAAVFLASGLAGCATPPPATDAEAVADFRQTNDPLEPTNRVFYKINDGLDMVILKPAAQAYRFAVPTGARTGIHNVLDNLGGPVRLANDTLQGKPRRAGDTAMRFVINSTIGLGGVFDVAKDLGYPRHDADFALTLANWGVPEGPFLFLPVLGPSGPRDATGFGVDIAIDPFTWIGRGTTAATIGSWTRTGAGALDERERYLDGVEQVKKTALDPYATFRSLYRQNRAGKLEAMRADDRATIPIWWPRAVVAATDGRVNGRSRDQTAK
ncbi:MAG: VacJ family lipoprotein [Acetobacteraceae bacterium]|nr:VacJ family lipoprotein [Acetobacteraceae bacterium]